MTDHNTIGRTAPQDQKGDIAAGSHKRRHALRFALAGFAARLPLGCLLSLAGLTLVLMITMPALISLERNEEKLGQLLGEKGASLIIAFENVLKMGLRSQVSVRLQLLLEEMKNTHDITFIAVTMPDGTILAHSNPIRVGEILEIDDAEADAETLRRLAPDQTARWFLLSMEGKRSFVVSRQFLPGVGMHRLRNIPVPLIFLGLDVSPFEATQMQNRAYVAMLAAVTLIIGIACLVALYYAERARYLRTQHRAAEGRVRILEEEVRRKEKLAAVGNLAAGVAHEIRNPLSSIKGYATYFGQRFPEGSEDREAAQVMVREVERLNRVITELIGLSRPTDVQLRPTDPSVVFEHVMRLLVQDAEHRKVVITENLPRTPVLIMADPDRLGQALLNLCLNALDAMPTGGSLELSSSPDGKGCALAVRDTGTGITEENLRHVFDPYFTTKSQGTGIGLATVHKIVEAMHGKIDVRSRPGSGTVFTLWLPLAEFDRKQA